MKWQFKIGAGLASCFIEAVLGRFRRPQLRVHWWEENFIPDLRKNSFEPAAITVIIVQIGFYGFIF